MPVFSVRYTYVDSEGREGSKEFETISLASHALAVVAADALAVDFAALTGADVLRYQLSGITAISDSVTAGSNRDTGITLSVRKADTFRGVLKVPAPLSSVLDGAGNVDISDALVTNFYDHFSTSGDFTFSDGEQAIALLSGTLDV